MMLSDNNMVQLWAKSELHTRDALNLMLTAVHPDDERDRTLKVLDKLRKATAAMQEIDRRQIGCGGR